ncbi:MAG: DUF3445 domain-containing protein [Alphaproteobacteria bacterium]|nr:DUF3445 domain-containing protein [Alphaproteobacteria bacterium]
MTTPDQAPWQRLGYKLKLGLRARDEAEWLPFGDLFGDDTARARQMKEKKSLLADRHEDVFAATPGSEPAGAEVLAMVRAHLQAHHAFAPTPMSADDDSLHPLDVAARLIPEDLLLLEPRFRSNGGAAGDYDWCLVAASLCFPAHWVLAEKMDKPLAEIHAPVPDYQERLATPMDRFFTNMKVGPISSRMNWSLQLGDELFAPHRSSRKAAVSDMDSQAMCLRVESQTLRKLPETGRVLFTIRTHMVPMARWRNVPGAFESLIDMLEEMSPQARHYKGAHLYQDALRKSLVD